MRSGNNNDCIQNGDLNDLIQQNEHQLDVLLKFREVLLESVAKMREDTADPIAEKYGMEMERLATRQLYLENTIQHLKFRIASIDYEQVKIKLQSFV